VFGWFRIGFCVRGARVSVGVSGRDVEKQVTRRVGEWIDGRGRRGGGAVWRGCWRVAGKGEGEVSGRLRGHDAFGQKSWVVSDQRDPAAVDVPQWPTARLIPPTTPPPPSKTPAAATPSTTGRLACTCTLVASTHPHSAAGSAPWEGLAWPHDAVAAAGRLHDAVCTLGHDRNVSNLHIVDQA
jgi:hypothetical protein